MLKTPTPTQVLNNPELFARHILKIQTKSGAIKPLIFNRAQSDYIANATKRDLIVKARQLGMSTCIQALGFQHVCTRSVHTLTLADIDQNTQKMRRIAKRFYDNWPAHALPRPLRGEDSAVIATYPEMNSSASIATAGSSTAGRGGTYHFLHGSEVAFWRNPTDTIAGALQAVPKEGRVILESTPNGAQGWFYETVMESLAGANEWAVHFYPWWHDPSYAIEPDAPLTYSEEEAVLVSRFGLSQAQINWRRSKISELKHLFKQEYPEDIRECFLLSGQGYFGDISHALKGTQYEPIEGHQYVAGLDFGQSNDYTVLAIGDVTTGQQVDILRLNRLPWHDILSRVLDRCESWGVTTLLCEYNSIGGPNLETLQRMAYERGLKIGINRFVTTAKSKPSILSATHAALQTGALTLLNLPEVRQEFQAFSAVQTTAGNWKYEASPGSHDDIVMASAIMFHAMARPPAMFIEL